LYCSKACYSKNGYAGRLTDDIPEVTEYSRFVAKLRCTARYLQWKKACLDRDLKQCIDCKTKESLTVHHVYSIFGLVKEYGLDQELIKKDPRFFNLSNGQTLCRSCHLKRHRRNEDE
jgi:5-methylcytosine-specific restriction endonuclease McrA